MTPSPTFLVLCLAALTACGSSVETRDGAGGSSSPTTSSATSPQGAGGGPGSGGADCQPWEPCSCAPCDEQGGTCLMRCNFGAGYDCYTPGPPAEGEFSCGGFENCRVGEACIDVEQGGGDSCIDHFCVTLPEICTYDRTCDCLAPYIDQPAFSLEPGACSEDGIALHVAYVGGAQRPPWDEPWCGTQTCTGDEACWACISDGGTTVDTYVCAVSDPGPDGSPSCTRQWGEPFGG